jgi:putative intracellular protease/amidase
MTQILMVLTSHDQLGDTGRSTGWYVSEAAHAWKPFVDAGFDVDFVSPKGGVPAFDGYDESDPLQAEFMATYPPNGPNTLAPDAVDPASYAAVYYVGGHGAMWDLPNDPAIAKASAAVYEQGGVVSAVCHGPAGLVNIKLSDGSPLVAGKKVSAFTNDEESAVGLTTTVPFLLADALAEQGAAHVPGPNFAANVVVDGRLVTGQNPASAVGVAEAVVALLK